MKPRRIQEKRRRRPYLRSSRKPNKPKMMQTRKSCSMRVFQRPLYAGAQVEKPIPVPRRKSMQPGRVKVKFSPYCYLQVLLKLLHRDHPSIQTLNSLHGSLGFGRALLILLNRNPVTSHHLAFHLKAPSPSKMQFSPILY